MRSLACSLLLASLLAFPACAQTRGATPAIGETMKQPRIAAALAARERMDNVVIARDMNAIEAGLAPDVILNGPNNRTNDRASIIANIGAGRVDHGTLERTIEYAAERGRDVILMGEEITRPRSPDDQSRTVYRRFTDIWTETDQGWRLVLRQATIYKTS